MNSIDSIKRIIRTKEFKHLSTLSKPTFRFSLIEMLDTTVTENAWSKVLAFLLDSRRAHGLKKDALTCWIDHFRCPTALRKLVEHPTIKVVAQTEWRTEDGRRLDILISLVDEHGKKLGVMGIENKVEAEESKAQIGDYQHALVSAFPGIPKVVLFLTPDERLPSTADADQTKCRALSVGYETIIKLLKELARGKIPVDLRRLLESLQHYIGKEIIMPEEKSKEIETLIRKLNKQRFSRVAMRLIAEYLPSVRRLTEDIEPAIERATSKKFPEADAKFRFDPAKSANPNELKWIPEELGRRTWSGRTQVAINFMLRCDRRDPQIGDEFQFIVAAWCRSDQDRMKARKLRLPRCVVTSQNLPSIWEPIWVGNSYQLHDLGEKDISGLTKLLQNGIFTTYPSVRTKVMAQFPKK